MMDKIKPCPFCGSEDVKYNSLAGCVICKACHSYGPNAAKEENAVKNWNAAPRKKDMKMEKCCKNCVHISKEVDGKVYCVEEVDADYSCKYWEQANPFESDPRLCWSCKHSYVYADDELSMYCGREIGNPRGYVCDKWEGADKTEDVKASISTPLNPSNSSGLDAIVEIAKRTAFQANVQQLLEEASELITACCKYLRATGSGQPTPVTEDQALSMIGEELADVDLVGDVLRRKSEWIDDVFTETSNRKALRWLERLEGEDEE